MIPLVTFGCVALVGSIGWLFARLWSDDDLVPTMLGALVGCILGAGLAYLIVQDAKAHEAWERACAAAGGRVEKTTSTGVGTGVGANGQPSVVTTTSSTYFCLTSDGRILSTR